MAVDLSIYKEIPLTGGALNTAVAYTATNGVTATSSVPTYNSSGYYYLGYLFNDTPAGSHNGYWLASASGTAYLTFDFSSIGLAYYPSAVRIAPFTRTDASSNYRIAISDDGAVWEGVTEWIYNSHGSGVNYIGLGQFREHELPRSARYLRLELTVNGSWGHTLNEVKFYRRDLEGKFLIEHGGEFKNYVPRIPAVPSTVNLIPLMTSNTAPSGRASASSQWDNTNYLPYKAFMAAHTATDAWHAISGAVLPQWLAYEFPQPVVIKAFSILSRVTYANQAPGHFILQGRERGSTIFEDIKTFVQSDGWPIDTVRRFEVTENETAYLEYRLYVTRISNGSTSSGSLSISRWEIYGAEIPEIPARWDYFNSADSSAEFINSFGAELNHLVMYERRLQQLTAIRPATNELVNPGEGAIRKTTAKLNLKKLIDVREVK